MGRLPPFLEIWGQSPSILRSSIHGSSLLVPAFFCRPDISKYARCTFQEGSSTALKGERSSDSGTARASELPQVYTHPLRAPGSGAATLSRTEWAAVHPPPPRWIGAGGRAVGDIGQGTYPGQAALGSRRRAGLEAVAGAGWGRRRA